MESAEGLMLLDWGHSSLGFADAFLALLLLIASFTDWQSRRIPNALVSVGLCVAVAGSALGITGLSLGACLSGAVVGLLLFLPLYVFRAVGAGDAKLMAVVGALQGTGAVLWIALYTGLAGALLAVVVLAFKGGWRQAGSDVAGLLQRLVWRISGAQLAVVEVAPSNSARLPYAIAILAGTVFWWIKGGLVS